MAQVILENIDKSFPARHQQRAVPLAAQDAAPVIATTPATAHSHVNVLQHINLRVDDGEFMVLVGPSGCGKSTLLRLIAGLEKMTSGNIWVGDRLVNELPPKARDIAMVFQNYALYPHMSVYDNLAFGLRRTLRRSQCGAEVSSVVATGVEERGACTGILPAVGEGKSGSSLENVLVGVTRSLPKQLRYITPREQAIDERVRNVAQLLQIEALLHRLPKQLSGGQKQRVALGRAIARNPQVFLMDEPLSNLDAKLRAETRAQIVKLQRQLETTTIYVTHDQTEAMTMGDRIAVMNQGQIQQVAPPLELYNHPATRFVAEFIGSPPMNFLPVQFHAPQAIAHSQFQFALPDHWANVLQPYDGQILILGIRPEHFNLSVAAPENLLVKVDLVEALGNDTYLSVSFANLGSQPFHVTTPATHTLQVRIPPDYKVAIGDQLWLALSPDKLHFFDCKTDAAIQL